MDERFAVPPPPLAVIATRPVQPFASVRDDRGSDVARRSCGRATIATWISPAAAPTRASRGDHYVEVELPAQAPRSGPLWLVAQGWIHPTDSSVNVAFGQGRHARADRGCRFTSPTRAANSSSRAPVSGSRPGRTRRS